MKTQRGALLNYCIVHLFLWQKIIRYNSGYQTFFVRGSRHKNSLKFYAAAYLYSKFKIHLTSILGQLGLLDVKCFNVLCMTEFRRIH
jgi:hypothetical protein